MPKRDSKGLRVLIAGGGTGGHLYPALGIAQGLREVDRRTDIRFVGSRYGLEERVLPEENEIFYPLNIRGLQRGFGPVALARNLAFPWRFWSSYRRCRQILREFQPQVVVGTGGYAAGLPLLAAQRKGIPTLLQEQNAYPGITTRRLAPRAKMVCLTYKESAEHLNTDRWVITGNPVRFDHDLPSKTAARQQLGLPARKTVVFILGGSLGSRPLNDHFLANWRTYTDDMGVQLLWQTGLADHTRVLNEVGLGKQVIFMPYIAHIAAAYIAADLVISRAGAMTISELTALGKPSVLVPFPSAASDHQTQNAKILEKKRAARVVPQSELSRGVLEQTVGKLLGAPGRLKDMAVRAKRLAKPDARHKIVEQILELVEN